VARDLAWGALGVGLPMGAFGVVLPRLARQWADGAREQWWWRLASTVVVAVRKKVKSTVPISQPPNMQQEREGDRKKLNPMSSFLPRDKMVFFLA